MLPHIPALRRGKPYTSLDLAEVKDCRTGLPLARISQVNSGILRKDLARVGESRLALKKLSSAELLQICERAAGIFLEAKLPLGDGGHVQSAQQYGQVLSATSGLPWVMVRRNMQKIANALRGMKTVLDGLTRGLDLSILDNPSGQQGGSRLSFLPVSQCLGVVMPSNSPAVNSLWLPAIPLKIPVILKPGREEPWTPFRLIQAFIRAGCPAEAFGFYPTDHEGASEMLRSCGRALLFGDQFTTAQYAHDPRIQVHGPGFSKIIIGEDQIDRWPDFLDLIASSISDNGGRSCVNASTLLVPKHAAEISDALARRLGPVAPAAVADENARISAFANRRMAEAIDATIEDALKTPGARDVTAPYRGGPRRVDFEGATYLRPTIVHCDSLSHPLANREFLFPYASVVQLPQSEMLGAIGPTLVLTAITQDPAFRSALLETTLVDRLNLGPIPTNHISWDQPHEGNLFEFLYRRRALELA